MNTVELSKKWRRLDAVPFNEIGEAREMCHEAVQLIASTGISYVQARNDDSHTNCGWSRSLKALVGSLIGPQKNICLGLNIAEFKMLVIKENWTIISELELNNVSLKDTLDWMRKNFENNNVDFNNFTLDKHYEIPITKVFNGDKFMINNKQAFQELSDYYSNADLILSAYSNDKTNAVPVRCWPHHFDIATLLNIDDDNLQSIGIGLSPGDSRNTEPYFYVTMWPYPDVDKISFAKLPEGHWNVKGWIGASLPVSKIINHPDEKRQFEMVLNFIENSVHTIKTTLLNI